MISISVRVILDFVTQKKCFPVAATVEDVTDNHIAGFYEICDNSLAFDG